MKGLVIHSHIGYSHKRLLITGYSHCGRQKEADMSWTAVTAVIEPISFSSVRPWEQKAIHENIPCSPPEQRLQSDAQADFGCTHPK